MQSLMGLSLFGSVSACGDLVGAALIFFQIPHSAIVRNKGWKTYWKSAPWKSCIHSIGIQQSLNGWMRKDNDITTIEETFEENLT